MVEHGLLGRAYAVGCRCTECTIDHRTKIASWREVRFSERVWVDDRLFAPNANEHGTVSTYTNWGCRCTPCSASHSLRMKAYRSRRIS